MSPIALTLATPADDPDLRRLLRDNPMPGRIQVTLEREPDFFIGANVEGPYHQTIVARDAGTQQVIALTTRSVRPVYINGEPGTLGYLSQMRIAHGYRSMRRAMTQVGGILRQLHQDGRTDLYLNSIVADNLPALRLLTAGLPGLPRLHAYARYHTLAIYTRRQRRDLRLPAGLHLEAGSPDYIPALLDCLARNGQRYQFFPIWTDENFLHPQYTPGLRIEDFWLVLDGRHVVGCAALWDQSAFKQTVVRGYAGSLGWMRRGINTVSWLAGLPKLPDPNQPFRFCFASHLAVDNDDPTIFSALVRQLHNMVACRQYSYFMLGLAESHPCLEQTRRSYAHIDYASQFYLSGWEENIQPLLDKIDQRTPGLEACLL